MNDNWSFGKIKKKKKEQIHMSATWKGSVLQ
jgi:hypothetical protein